MRKRTKGPRWSALPILAVTVGLAAVGSALASSEPPRKAAAAAERLASGERLFQRHCASCHGKSGRGDGPVAKDLKVAPADLTRLAARHQGAFPREQVAEAIDGRLAVRAHGTSRMPVWGLTFQSLGNDRDQERDVREWILDLTAYVESMQR
jgi:mono/diheme cytochrome c family protein